MTRLEDLKVGAVVHGIRPHTPVTILALRWHGDNVLEVTFREPNGESDSRLLFRDAEVQLSIDEGGQSWSFDADGGRLRLASEALRIRLAHLFDPFLAVHTSFIRPLPHQISAVYEKMLPRQPLRYLLADDPGAGKTIMAGLVGVEDFGFEEG